jgi:cation:H+ antiporter
LEVILLLLTGLGLLLLFGIFVYITISDFLRQKEEPLLVTVEQITPDLVSSPVVNWLYVIAGCIGLMLGGQLTIDNGVALAARLEVSPAIVGMMVVAIGTSLPELVTSIIAAMRREADLCVGNVIGSNIFNALLVLPVSGLVRPLSIPTGGTIDVVMSLLLALALIPIFIAAGGTMSRLTGAGFIAAYLGYMTARATGVI